MTARIPLFAAGSLAFAGALGFAATQMFTPVKPADAAPGPAPAMPAPIAKVQIRSVPVHLAYPGRIESLQELTLQAKATGFLLEQVARDGTDVKEGDLLYRIDDRDTRARLDQARAQLERDSASLDYARSNYERGSQLAKSGALAKDTFDQRISAVKQAEAAMAIDQAAIRSAELNLADTEIRAPFDGRLGRNRAAAGTFVNAGATTLNTLVQLSPIYVTFNPTERELARIQEARRAGDVAVEVTPAVEGGQVQRGRLVFLDNALDRTTGTITARGVIDNAERALLPGQYVRVRVAIGDIPEAKIVPQVAIGSSQLGKFVYTVNDKNIVEQKLVILGQSVGDGVAVASGLTGDEKIITGNLQKIGPGMPVAPQM